MDEAVREESRDDSHAFILLLFLIYAVPLYYVFAFFHPFEPVKYALIVLGAGLLAFEGLFARPWRLRWSPVLWGFLLWLAAALLSLCNARYLPLAGERIALIASGLVIFLAALQCSADPEKQEKIIEAIVIVATLEALVIILQFAGLAFNDVKGLAGKLRMYGTLGNSNYVAAFLMMALPLAGHCFLQGLRRVWLLPALLIAAGIVLTFSRGTWLFGLLAVVLSLPWLVRQWRQAPADAERTRRLKRIALVLAGAGAGGLVILLATLPASIWHNLKDLFPIQGRLLIYRVALAMIARHPWLGVGVNQFSTTYVDTQQQLFARDNVQGLAMLAKDVEHAHNEYLQFWAETGLAGLAALVILLGQPLWRGIRARAFGAAHISLLFVALYSLVDFPLQTPANFFLFCLVLALAAGQQSLKTLEIAAGQGRRWLAVALFSPLFLWQGLQVAYKLGGEFYTRKGELAVDVSQEIHYFSAATAINPADAEKHYYLAGAFFANGQLAEAEAAIDRALAGLPRFYTYHLKAQILIDRNRFAEAKRIYFMLKKAFPGFALSQYYIDRIDMLERSAAMDALDKRKAAGP